VEHGFQEIRNEDRPEQQIDNEYLCPDKLILIEGKRDKQQHQHQARYAYEVQLADQGIGIFYG
jgi:hypothetical protein